MAKINLGGGEKKVEGYTNIDILDIPEVDIVHDISEGLPLSDDSVEEILANHILEHIEDTVQIFEEMYRVCKNDALIKIRVPYFKSVGAFKDPTHVSFFTEKTFEYFGSENDNLPNYKIKANFEIEKIWFGWSARWMKILPFKTFLNKYLWNIARTMFVRLRVKK